MSTNQNKRKQEAGVAWKLTTIKKNLTSDSNFELTLKQCVVNYYGDKTIAK